tara:strand:+ start:312 stop:902 length:591 start_codon:yes stop_codon:yes gene_type:complete
MQTMFVILAATLPTIQAYIYHSHIALQQPYSIHFNPHTSKDMKKIDEEGALVLASHWYDELKNIQYDEEDTTPLRKQIDFLYSYPNDDYLQMSHLMNFNYNIQMDDDVHNEYLIWKPKIKPEFMNDVQTSSIFYPCFRQTLCLISFQRTTNNVEIQDMIFTPFWNGETKIIKKKIKGILTEYFLGYLKHKRIHFQS